LRSRVEVAAARERTLARDNARLYAEAGEALGLLDVVFEHAPVGLALLDTELRYVRVNDRLAEINGVPAADHIGHTIAELLPDLPASVQDDAARVLSTGSPLGDMAVSGETPARPGEPREWVTSYWPVRRAGGEELIGVGVVVIEVTERRTAERALRDQTDRYETLLLALSEVGEGMVLLEQDGRCVYANSAFEQLSGYTFPELAAMESVMDLVVESEREEARRRAVLRVQRGLVDEGYRLRMRRRDGELVELEVAGVPLDVGDRQQLVVVVRDVTARVRAEIARERALARSALMAEASELFDQSLDEQRTIGSVARLCVRELAETCVILLGDTPTRVRRVAAVAREPARERALLEALLRDPLEERAEYPMLTVMRGGAGFVAPSPAGLGTERSVIVPLRARGRVHGVLAAGFDVLDPGEEDEVVALFEDFGRRAALAVDSARLYEERDHVARTLQRSLLPAELPEIPGVELAARYLAAGEGNEVGGDFYDCFATGGGDWAVVIGDVCGKGAEAAAITALARYTLRAAVLHTRRPRTVLGELNEALLRQKLDYRFCTALYASLTPREGRVTATVATGGHPLPLVLRAGGEVETAGRPGTLLGIVEDPQVSESTIDLGPGDALVLFTDGVIEATPGDRALGPGGLAGFLSRCAGTGAAGIAEAVEREALEAHGGRPRDDVAVVVVRVHGGEPAPFGALDQGVAAPS
ncbi:MAG: SpoIIE family protein phosphatase, partial [Solirubrobacteraceae bacterium]